MIKVDTTLFDLNTVYSELTHQKTWLMTGILRLKQEDLEELLEVIEDQELYEGQFNQEKESIKAQLEYVNKNVKTFETALMFHENKMIEKRFLIGHFETFYLN